MQIQVLTIIHKMSTFAPDSNRSLTDIFDEKIPAVDGCIDEDDVNAKEKCILSPKLNACLKWLI